MMALPSSTGAISAPMQMPSVSSVSAPSGPVHGAPARPWEQDVAAFSGDAVAIGIDLVMLSSLSVLVLVHAHIVRRVEAIGGIAKQRDEARAPRAKRRGHRGNRRVLQHEVVGRSVKGYE